MRQDKENTLISEKQHENTPFVKSLQQRLFTLGKQKNTTADEKRQLFMLIAAIEQAQTNANGCVSVEYLDEQLAADNSHMQRLQLAFPRLIGTVEQVQTPIVCFAQFVAFRRRYNEMQEIVDYLHQHYQLIPPSEQALATISWQVGQGGEYAMSDEQRLAALTAASLPFSLITGGAGTGKTTTLAKALELILLDNPQAVIQLAAPTGKAAQRLNESLQQQLPSVSSSVREQLAILEATTLHRLLQISESTGRAYQNAANPLFCDVLAVDESSMMGGALFRQLIAAMLPNTRLILLGDANQLPAIDHFAFFNEVSCLAIGYTAEFCQLATRLGLSLNESTAPLANHLCRLTVAKRFAEASTVQQCANAILNNDAAQLIQHLGEHFYPLSNMTRLCQQLSTHYPESRTELLKTLTQRVVLCAKRQGRYGSEAINRYLDEIFRQRLGQGGMWYEGRRVLIEQNDYQLNINNGDVGVCQWSQQQWIIVFDDGRELAATALPQQYSLAFALSIHKSQGSEYQQVDIVLDDYVADFINPLVTQALIYTAITRAKTHLTMYADQRLLEQVLQQKAEKNSPLAALLAINASRASLAF